MDTQQAKFRLTAAGLLATMLLAVAPALFAAQLEVLGAQTARGVGDRVIRVDLVALQVTVPNNRLGAQMEGAQIYALARDVEPISSKADASAQQGPADASALQPGAVQVRSYKRPRPLVLRANLGDILEIHFRNLLPTGTPGPSGSDAGVQILGLDWLDADNGTRIAPGAEHVYRFLANEEGVFMLFSPNGKSIPASQADYYLFGAVNVQPREAEWYRSQVTREDLRLATYQVSTRFMRRYWDARGEGICRQYLGSEATGLPAGMQLRRQSLREGNRWYCPEPGVETGWELMYPLQPAQSTEKTVVVRIGSDGLLRTQTRQPVVDYQAVYPQGHPRRGSPILNMLARSRVDGSYEIAHSDLTAMITGPGTGSFPYYLNSPSFRLNPATPNRRHPYREFTVAYHISPNTAQAFEAFNTGPLVNTLAAGADAFGLNYGITGIGSAIYANRTGRGPMGINGDGVDLLFEEFFLSSWAIGDPAVLVDVPANDPQGRRATRAYYPDDPSNVYHSYMRDRVKMRVLNAGSVAPHVHHQHAHQWLHSPDSADSHYLDSQMINPGSTYTLEMTYNGSGNRNLTVGDSIFHCHIYPHFAQGMWGLWRVHDVFEEGTELDAEGRPVPGARALPDGEIVAGTPIPALVPMPTLGMAPMPAPVRLVDNGRRIEVLPSRVDARGEPEYINPGFPFFVPGVAGHRAPHPPMDFAWRETAEGEPLLYAEAAAPPFRKPGDRVYLDGGLPRHLVLGGETAREYHSRWDFSKDIALYDDAGKLVAGKLLAMELPEQGTPVERAAMAAHATRTHATHLPDGMPGNFTLNGLPPVPGAPYAAPDVDDDGNSTFEVRRYKAAVVQRDVVFNKQGWHYPQQRFITLLEDVKPTVDGSRPPEPFFFRANTGETVEFWHTNLVPKYYELDDFQVRTPTDILGQHIHLVKFDVTSSDGAGNGFNYEDGTFSPDEVRERIDTINAAGGLYHFDPRVQGKGQQRTQLEVTPYQESYGTVLGDPPAGQDWNGAQTTVQRYATDELLNLQGEDRTLRTVFTHDHFGPSTHQQVGLYGAMLVEPQGSTWKNAVTGCPMPDPDGVCAKREDGGPTSWQAVIETHDSLQSYREFALAVADMQLAYTPDSPSEPGRPAGAWFTTASADFPAQLDRGVMPAGLSEVFTAQGAVLPPGTQVTVTTPGESWVVQPNAVDQFQLSLDGSQLAVHNATLPLGWSAPAQAIWPPTAPSPANGVAPYPTIIADPGGGGDIGLWTTNYRNEPLDARIQGPSAAGSASTSDAQRATDTAFAYASIERLAPRLNTQPQPGSPIDGGDSGFRYPSQPLLPEGPDGVQPTDPYTPLLRAYAGDRVEVRTVVGAVDSLHSFRVQGARWWAEPSYENSGFREVQGMGISEHFEMIFTLPPAGASPGNPRFVDQLYAGSAATQGQAKGSWGLLRSYQQPVADLVALKSNPPGQRPMPDFYQPPAGTQVREFEIEAVLAADGKSLHYQIAGQPQTPLILRAVAGDWIRITLHNRLDPAAVAKLGTQFTGNAAGNASSATIQPYAASANVGLNPMLLSYDSASAAGLNVGFNSSEAGQTVPPGESRSVLWFAGEIRLRSDGQRSLVPVEFGGVNLLPADPLLQSSYGLYGALIVEPMGATWHAEDAHALSAVIRDPSGQPMFTEVVVSGAHTAAETQVAAGSEVRLRVLNPGAGSPGTMSDSTNLIAIEGHGWPEEPYLLGSRVIARNPLSQWMGTQQVTPLESYTLLLPSAGGEAALPGQYGYYYWPKGPSVPTRLGVLKVQAKAATVPGAP
ncbi:hypothetical protein [Aquimonas sp.]|jgi:hypothetical protein|uniref:hypothetical protein n=1 Tax=Aquimonas sp. TaxID=1872588 RepID=UPI0037BF547F